MLNDFDRDEKIPETTKKYFCLGIQRITLPYYVRNEEVINKLGNIKRLLMKIGKKWLNFEGRMGKEG